MVTLGFQSRIRQIRPAIRPVRSAQAGEQFVILADARAAVQAIAGLRIAYKHRIMVWPIAAATGHK